MEWLRIFLTVCLFVAAVASGGIAAPRMDSCDDAGMTAPLDEVQVSKLGNDCQPDQGALLNCMPACAVPGLSFPMSSLLSDAKPRITFDLPANDRVNRSEFVPEPHPPKL